MLWVLACSSQFTTSAVEHPVRSDDGDTALPQASRDDADDAVVEYITLPDLACGQVTTMTIVVTNTGTSTWTEDAEVRLGAVDDDDPLATATRHQLPEYAQVAPGDSWVFSVLVEAPDQPGTYTTDWGMVREHVHWFGSVDEKVVEVDCDEVDPPDEETPFDLDDVVWLHGDVSGWPVTSTLASVTVDADQICLDYDKADEWPEQDPFGEGTLVVGNPWVFIEHEGTWYGATWEWLRPGQTCKSRDAVAGDHIKTAPFDAESGWRPTSGERLYFMVSSLARLGTSSVDERTDVIEVVWP